MNQSPVRLYPRLGELIDPSRWRASRAELASYSNEFDDDVSGRGDSYRQAQSDREARKVGVNSLMRLAGCGGSPMLVLDVFGGNGLIADMWTAQAETDTVITADISATMIEQATSRGLPAIQQSAQNMILADNVVDAVLMAYGTHHLHPAQRQAAFSEALRVLKPGGRVVVHDFRPDSPMAQWFSSVVDRFGQTPHPYEHFTDGDLNQYLSRAGFGDIAICDIYDPFTICRDRPGSAAIALATHMAMMYGLRSAVDDRGLAWLIRQITSVFHIAKTDAPAGVPLRQHVHLTASGYVAELPRMAIAATAYKLPIVRRP